LSADQPYGNWVLTRGDSDQGQAKREQLRKEIDDSHFFNRIEESTEKRLFEGVYRPNVHIPFFARMAISSIRLDNAGYDTDEEELCWGFLPSPPSTFPRNLICFSGGVRPVQGIKALSYGTSSNETLTSLCVPSRVEFLNPDCLAWCERLSVVAFERDSKLSGIDAGAFTRCTALKTMFIPASVAFLGAACFSYCATLSIVSFGSGSQVRQIPEYAFDQCGSLSRAAIPSSVQVLGQRCFCCCQSLSLVTFDSGSRLTQIAEKAFDGCRSISRICIPSSVRALSAFCFEGCRSLKTVSFESDSKLSSIATNAFSKCPSGCVICIPPHLARLFADCPQQLRIIDPDDDPH
jgi:hypothetical protein